LDEDAFNKLLMALDEDRDLAAVKYENIRNKLITFFRCHGCLIPEECADLTINRVARKIAEGAVVLTGEPARFFFGVARNVLHEYQKEERRRRSAVQPLPPDPADKSRQEEEKWILEQRIACLERCLESLSTDKRQLIKEYYQGETARKIENRALLAKRLGIPINTLRIQALRIRRKLQKCVADCLDQGANA
jgi:RNA polymerase sigma factor (sigma-70 family)